jgi:hypothetical protein
VELSWNAAFKIGWAVWLVATFMGFVFFIVFFVILGGLMTTMLNQ